MLTGLAGTDTLQRWSRGRHAERRCRYDNLDGGIGNDTLNGGAETTLIGERR